MEYNRVMSTNQEFCRVCGKSLNTTGGICCPVDMYPLPPTEPLPRVEDLIKEGEQTGDRYNDGKPDYSLLPTEGIDLAAKVFSFGAKKYDDFNWA